MGTGGSLNIDLNKLLPVLENRAEILAVYFFGSAARSMNAPRDLDLAVILRDGFEPDRFYEFTLAEEMERMMLRYYDFKPFLDYYNRCLHERIKVG